MSKLQEELVALAQARRTRAVLKGRCNTTLKVYRQTPEYATWEWASTLFKKTKALVSAAEAGVRDLAIKSFDGRHRFPAKGVEIKQYNVVEYVETDTLRLKAWARENLPGVFVFDEKRFEAAVKANLVPASLARMAKEPRAVIKRDLGFLLETAGE